MEQWQVDILRVVDQEAESVQIPRLPLSVVSTFLAEVGVSNTDQETNGWEVDFWVGFERNGQGYTLAGDLWYSKTFKFSDYVHFH